MQEFKLDISRQYRPFPGLPKPYPILSIEFQTLPSINDVIYLSPKERAKEMGKDRVMGYAVGSRVIREKQLKTKIVKNPHAKSSRFAYTEKAASPLTQKPLFCFAEVYRQKGKKNPELSDRQRDIYNPLIKSFIDGLTDAGLWLDDNETYHKDFWIHYAGLSDTPKIIISFYEIES